MEKKLLVEMRPWLAWSEQVCSAFEPVQRPIGQIAVRRFFAPAPVVSVAQEQSSPVAAVSCYCRVILVLTIARMTSSVWQSAVLYRSLTDLSAVAGSES